MTNVVKTPQTKKKKTPPSAGTKRTFSQALARTDKKFHRAYTKLSK